MTIYSEFFHKKKWFSSSLCNSLPEGNPRQMQIAIIRSADSMEHLLGQITIYEWYEWVIFH